MESQKTIGIVGGGQLGRMLTLAALPLGFKVIVVETQPNGPASQVGAKEIIAKNLFDKKALEELAKRADFITIEIEHIDTDTLEKLANSGSIVNPSPKTIKLIQDKYEQKLFLKKSGIPVADFAIIKDAKSAEKLLKYFGGEMIVKTRHGAYDGRGNMVVKSKKDLDQALKLFEGRLLYAEALVPFQKELSVVTAKSINGQIAIYSVVETIHERNICIEVHAPAHVSLQVKQTAEQLARKIAGIFEGAGVFGIEMFLDDDGKVLINEIAPRVHNSGHHTIESSRTSQFEQHIRAISGLPLGDTSMVVPSAVMVNILGQRDGPTAVAGLDLALDTPHTSVHFYGKSPTKIDRKMGHITATGNTIEESLKRARHARKQISL